MLQKHFDSDQFEQNRQDKRLKRAAVPTIFEGQVTPKHVKKVPQTSSTSISLQQTINIKVRN